jgi:hypothetical protein
MLIHISYKNGNQETILNVEEIHYGYNMITISLYVGSKEEILLSEISIFKVVNE